MQDDLSRLPPAAGFLRTHLDGKLVKGGAGGVHLTPSGSSVLFDSPGMPAGRPGCIIEGTRVQHETSDADLRRYSVLVREGRKEELVNAIGLVAPGTEDVEILKDAAGDSYLSVTVAGGRPRPLHDLGGGAVRLARLLIGIFASQGAILLSDELENGIHHSAQREVWDKARQWINLWEVQLIATTHSAEFLEAAIDAFADRPKDLSVHRLFRNPGTGRTEVATFTGEALAGARNLDLEIR
ncbi:MAG: ATP-binding protein [Chloroflexi bacterium]|nr:ATP-binding protein [Chloroflexota bacterium]